MTRIGRGAIGIAVAVGLAVGLGEVPGAGAQGAPPIRVGFSSAMTGPSAVTGEGVKWAAQMLADEYNAKGGIAGRKIELYFGDNAGTPGEAVSATRKLVDVDKVDVILDVPVTLSLEVGRSRMPIRNLLQLNQGSVIELERGAGEPLDVYVNGTLIAHGEVVVINDRFGVRLTDVVSPSERIRRLR